MTTAQFLSRDPLVALTRQPYSYVGDIPLNAIDSSGLMDPDTEDTAFGAPSQKVQELQRALDMLNRRLAEAEQYGGPDPGHAKAIRQARNRVANASNKVRNDKSCPDSLREQANRAVNDPGNYEPPSADLPGDPTPGIGDGGVTSDAGSGADIGGQDWPGEGDAGGDFGGLGGVIGFFLPIPLPIPHDEYCALHRDDIGRCGA